LGLLDLLGKVFSFFLLLTSIIATITTAIIPNILVIIILVILVVIIFMATCPIYVKEATDTCFSNYWLRRGPSWDGGNFHLAFIMCGHRLFFMLVLPGICNGRINRLAILLFGSSKTRSYLHSPSCCFPTIAR